MESVWGLRYSMTYSYSKNAVELINEVEKFSNSKLNKKAELINLYESAITSDKVKDFEDLSFTAKYLRGLMRVLNEGKQISEVGSMEKIKSDFTMNMKKATELIKNIISNSDDSMKKYFEENFLEMSQNSLVNVNELLADLEWVKMYMNKVKREDKN